MMRNHTKEDFEIFMSQLKETNATLDFFCDFRKIAENVDVISMKLHQLNYLIGQENMDLALRKLWDDNPKVFEVLDILIAVRKKDKKQVMNSKGEFQLVEHYFADVEGVIEYVEKTGLGEVLRNKRITNLVDYVFGVETGLDTNARKNRSGHQMETAVARLFDSQHISYQREVYSDTYTELRVLGEDKKRFDFVIETSVKRYLIEVNFYSGGGSKLNEVARAYSELSPKINSVDGFEFVWITDGKGWEKAKSKLEEAFYIIPNVYNLTTLVDLIGRIKQEMKPLV
ncbi:MAG: type II restriction endonuclease [Alloprevotella sp.]